MNFAITGAAGYIAPRHLKAIADTGNQLVAALDPHDAVGGLDRFGYDVDFFTETERFERHLLKRQREARYVDWLSVCSPNYLHDAHIAIGLRNGANVICEKPIVLSPWNLDALEELEQDTGKRVYTVLQLRLHPEIVAFKELLATVPPPVGHRHKVFIVYNTPRGRWYHRSWKGDEEKSGGLLTNIGIHLFDLVLWLFGPCKPDGCVSNNLRPLNTAAGAARYGYLELEHADVDWTLSIDPADTPTRIMTVDGIHIDLSKGFVDAHTEVYRRTLGGHGFTITDARPAVELVHRLRTAR